MPNFRMLPLLLLPLTLGAQQITHTQGWSLAIGALSPAAGDGPTFYKPGFCLETAWHLGQGQRTEGRLRGGAFQFGSKGEHLGNGVMTSVSASGQYISYDWVIRFGSLARTSGLFLAPGIGGTQFHTPRTTRNPANSETPSKESPDGYVGPVVSLGVGWRQDAFEVELRYQHFQGFGGIGGDEMNPLDLQPHHVGLLVRGRF